MTQMLLLLIFATQLELTEVKNFINGVAIHACKDYRKLKYIVGG